MKNTTENESKALAKVLELTGIKFAHDGSELTSEESMATDGLLPVIQYVANELAKDNNGVDDLGYEFETTQTSLTNLRAYVDESKSPASVRLLYLLESLTLLTNPIINHEKVCQVSGFLALAEPYMAQPIPTSERKEQVPA